jgi:hypothetical protein
MKTRFTIGFSGLALGAIVASAGCQSGEACQPGGTGQPYGNLTMRAIDAGKPVGISFECGYMENGTADFGFSDSGLAAQVPQVAIAIPGTALTVGSFAVGPGGASLTVKDPDFATANCALASDGVITIGAVLLGPEDTTTISGSFSIPAICSTATASLTSASGVFVLTQPTPTPIPTPR